MYWVFASELRGLSDHWCNSVRLCWALLCALRRHTPGDRDAGLEWWSLLSAVSLRECLGVYARPAPLNGDAMACHFACLSHMIGRVPVPVYGLARVTRTVGAVYATLAQLEDAVVRALSSPPGLCGSELAVIAGRSTSRVQCVEAGVR